MLPIFTFANPKSDLQTGDCMFADHRTHLFHLSADLFLNCLNHQILRQISCCSGWFRSKRKASSVLLRPHTLCCPCSDSVSFCFIPFFCSPLFPLNPSDYTFRCLSRIGCSNHSTPFIILQFPSNQEVVRPFKSSPGAPIGSRLGFLVCVMYVDFCIHFFVCVYCPFVCYGSPTFP